MRYMNTINNMFYCLLLLLATACSAPQSAGPDIRHIDVGEAFGTHTQVKLSDYATGIDYVPLETHPDALMIGTDHTGMKSYGDKLYFYYHSPLFMVPKFTPLCFSSKGEFLFKIGSIGRSKNDLMYAKDLIINEYTDEIVVPDYNLFHFFSLDGELKRNVEVLHNDLKFEAYCVNDNSYAFIRAIQIDEKDTKNRLYTIDSCGILAHRMNFARLSALAFDRILNKTLSQSKGSVLYQSDTILHLYTPKDTIYTLDLKSGRYPKMKPLYKVDYGNYGRTDYWGASLAIRSHSLIETQSMVMLEVMFPYWRYPDIDHKYRWSCFVYDKNSARTYHLQYDETYGFAGFTNDLDGGMPFYPTYMNDGKMYRLVDAVDFIEFAQMGNSARMKEVASKLTDDSNPVLVVVTLK